MYRKNAKETKIKNFKKNTKIKHLIFFTIVLLFITFIICLIYFLKRTFNLENTEVNIYETDIVTSKNTENLDVTKNEETKKDDEKENQKKEQKIDLNFYIEKNGVKTLITSHTCSWVPENVMGVFYAVPSTENTLPLTTSFDTLWKEYISAYEDSSSIRIGYNISFTLNSGEIIDRVILNPDDAYYMFPKVMVFLYDDVNLVPGKRYYHITQDDMTENTICSSIKLVGDVESKNISSDITLTAFCYTSEDDFDKETGKYIGESYSTITISNISK